MTDYDASLVEAPEHKADDLTALLVDNAPDGVVIVHKTFGVTASNAMASSILGRSAEEFRTFGVGPALQAVLESDHVCGEFEFHCGDAKRFLICNTSTRGPYTVVHLRDVTALQAERESLVEARSEIARAFHEAVVGMAVLDRDGRFVSVNRSFEQMLSYSADELRGTSFLDYTHPDDRARGVRIGTQLLLGEIDRFQLDGRWVRRDGEVAWARLSVGLTPDDGGSPQYVAQVQDITDEVVARAELAERQQWYEALIEHSNDMLLVINADATLQWGSPAAMRLFGYAKDSQIGRPFADFIHPEDLDRLIGEYTDLMGEPGGARSTEVRVLHASGSEYRHTEIVATNHLDNPSVNGIVANIRDITERVEAATRVEYQAFHDSLTGLANRALLLDRLAHAVERSKRSTEDVALLFLDLDRFKLVNDSLGHDAGDQLLVEVAGRLVDAVRAHDTVARLGGDEFVVLVEALHHPGEIEIIAERIRDSLATPVMLGDNEVTISASIGIAFDADHSPESLLRDADTALYRAKDRGKNRFEIFDESLRAEAVHRLQTDRELRRALDTDRIVVEYQPIVRLADGHIVGAEALVRYRGPTGEIHHPGEFLTVAEETGLIVPIGGRVIELACAQLADWRERYGLDAPPRVHINVAARQLGSPDLRVSLDRAVNQHGLEPGCVVLEYTESTAISADRSTTRIVELMHDQGYGLAIDDFGTGYSSLAYLKRFPVDTVKLDQHFVGGLGNSADDLEIVRAVLSLAHSLNLDTVAEGVEEIGQVTLLRSLGCRYAEGYLMSRPVPPAQFDLLIERGGSLIPD